MTEESVQCIRFFPHNLLQEGSFGFRQCWDPGTTGDHWAKQQFCSLGDKGRQCLFLLSDGPNQNAGFKPAQLYDSHLQLPKNKLIQYCSETKEKQFLNIINNYFKEAFTPRNASEESMYGLAPCITLCYSLQRLNRCPESLPLEKQLNMIKALKNYVASFHQDSLAENTEEIAC